MVNCQTNKQCKLKCELCDKHPATARITNMYNSKKLNICKGCADYIAGNKKEVVNGNN